MSLFLRRSHKKRERQSTMGRSKKIDENTPVREVTITKKDGTVRTFKATDMKAVRAAKKAAAESDITPAPPAQEASPDGPAKDAPADA